MANHVSYPKTLPIVCFSKVVSIIRAGEVSEKRAELFLHLWNVQGYAQSVLVGVPDDNGHLFGDGEEQHLIALESALADFENTPDAELFGEVGVVDAAIDPVTIIALISFILTLLKKWRNR